MYRVCFNRCVILGEADADLLLFVCMSRDRAFDVPYFSKGEFLSNGEKEKISPSKSGYR